MVSGLLSGHAVLSAEPVKSDSDGPVKNREQIRCELLNVCPEDIHTRDWITRTGAVEVATQTKRGANFDTRPKPFRASSVAKRQKHIAAAPEIGGRGSDLFITFPLGSAELVGRAREQAEELYAALTPTEWATHRFRISGHTDSLGPPSYNMRLSKVRAEALAAKLTEKGVKPDQLEVVGYGSKVPTAGLKKSDARNRRVQIRILK